MSTRAFTLFAMFLMASIAGAQRHKLTAINAETPEGKILHLAGLEEDEAKKLALLEQFATQFSSHSASGWVYTQMQNAYLKAGNPDGAIGMGEKLLTIDAMDIDAAYGNLKASEAKKDSDAVLKWSAVTSEIARKAAGAPKGEDQTDEEHKHAQDFARQVEVYTEYSLYASALQEPDPKKAMLLVETLNQRNPKSQYVAMSLPRYSVVAREAKAIPAAVALGEKAFENGQYSEDMLLVMADHYLQEGKSPDKVITYSEKILEVMNGRAKPEGMSDADWDRKKAFTTGLAYWMAGTTLNGQKKFAPADKMLRAALPLVKDNPQLYGPALFHLGLANYRMAQASKNKAQIADAVKFSKQAAAIKGPLQAQAAKNVRVMQAEFRVR